MFIDYLLERFAEFGSSDAVVWRDKTYSYDWLLNAVRDWKTRLERESIPQGSVVVAEGDFSPNAIALFMALVEHDAVLVPMSQLPEAKRMEAIEVSEAEWIVSLDGADGAEVGRTGVAASSPLYSELRSRQHPGLVLFSSGSTGKSKGAVHDMVPLLKKFEARRRASRTVPFLLYDHIGGVNTMLHVLSNGGCLITVQQRSPEAVMRTVERHRVEVLPASPTFLNLILISEAYRNRDLSSLQLVTYGTEPMPESTLRRFHEVFPQIKLLQTYGLSELGIMQTKSKSSDSLWLQVGGDGYSTRVVDGMLQIKARSAMLGYLNAPSPFTEDGWFITGDRVLVEGEYMRILGRESEMINVGGEKVYPAEVESVIQELDEVSEVVVYKEPNPITGNIVCAKVTVKNADAAKGVVLRVKKHCASRLQRFKVPAKVVVASGPQHNARFKRVRP